VRKTLIGCLALVGEDARPSDGPVDIVIDGHLIRDIRPAGVATPEGEPINLKGRLVTAGLINGHHHSHEGFFKGRDASAS
jgi:guanine deaminase